MKENDQKKPTNRAEGASTENSSKKYLFRIINTSLLSSLGGGVAAALIENNTLSPKEVYFLCLAIFLLSSTVSIPVALNMLLASKDKE